jgi:hypothetical protein
VPSSGHEEASHGTRIVGLTALILSTSTSHQVAWAVVALIAGLAMSVAVFFELRAARRAKEARLTEGASEASASTC